MASAKAQETVSFTQKKNLNQWSLFNQLLIQVSLCLLMLSA